MVNEFWTKLQLWPQNVITQILQSLVHNFISTLASSSSISSKPKNLTFLQAASIPYVGLTAWSALAISGGLDLDWKTNHFQQKILVFGASGGVGTFAVQLLKACNYRVSGKCLNVHICIYYLHMAK